MRNGLLLVVILVLVFAVFDRGERVHYAYPGGLLAVLVVVLLLGLVLGWF